MTDHQGGASAATDEDVIELLNACKKITEKALLHFLLSTGIRPGGIADPVLRKKHLVELSTSESRLSTPDGTKCYGIRVYDESKEGYWAFLTPEASDVLDKYFVWRTNHGETLTDESPLFVPMREDSKEKYMSDVSTRSMVYRIINRSSMKRVKTGHRYDKAVIYMFRKRFNGKLKMDENNINSNIAEKLMAHNSKEIKLDTRYLDVPIEKLFAEFKKAIFELTVDPTERQKITIQKKDEEITELEKMKEKVIEEKDVSNGTTKLLELLMQEGVLKASPRINKFLQKNKNIIAQ